jgi:hypothetical protein
VTALIENAEFEGWDAIFELIERWYAKRQSGSGSSADWRFSHVEKRGTDKEDKSKAARLSVAGTLVGQPVDAMGSTG